jgi:hypothetical protein
LIKPAIANPLPKMRKYAPLGIIVPVLLFGNVATSRQVKGRALTLRLRQLWARIMAQRAREIPCLIERCVASGFLDEAAL